MSCKLHPQKFFRAIVLEMLIESGVEVMLYVFFAGVIKEGNSVKGVIIESKSGREVILAKTVIDCTGDADVAYRAGVNCEQGNDIGGVQRLFTWTLVKG